MLIDIPYTTVAFGVLALMLLIAVLDIREKRGEQGQGQARDGAKSSPPDNDILPRPGRLR
ncbi:hypothetical protein [Azospirillum sp. SYSU D00513]|uniref:hypothetical protein n=1 Tax=Azospirillum sp. SYSU D00513 TaxID=2812561 RepID=UPI001A969791|nr:hypothetical protein [Azospirillum sp. SYSU D00513]